MGLKKWDVTVYEMLMMRTTSLQPVSFVSWNFEMVVDSTEVVGSVIDYVLVLDNGLFYDSDVFLDVEYDWVHRVSSKTRAFSDTKALYQRHTFSQYYYDL
jgi:hypothetical protein